MAESSPRAQHAGDIDIAESYCSAMRFAEERRMRPLVAHCHFSLGKFYRPTKKREQAEEHFTTAITMYRDMEMPFWLQQAEGEIEKLG